MAWAWHGKCESETAALCKLNGKDTLYTFSGTAWQGNGMGTAFYVWIGLKSEHGARDKSICEEQKIFNLRISVKQYDCMLHYVCEDNMELWT